MWKIICLFSLFAKVLSAPSGCIEMCNSLNLQSFQKLSCCGMPMTSSPNDDKNWNQHKDFQTNDGALVHTKDGRFAHGNTRGSYNEMSYYKEFGSGSNHNFGGSFGTNQHSGSNFGANQKIEDLATSSQSSFEALFQSKFSNLMQNLHNSVSHLQELKRKGQLETQECVYPCIPVPEQINEMQQQVNRQQQYIQRMREDLWASQQRQNSMTEHVEQVPVQPTYHPGQVVTEVNHHESHRHEKTVTHPRITTKVIQQPVKYISTGQQTQGTGSTNQGYYKGSTSQQTSSDYSQGYGSGIQSQAGYDQKNVDYGSQIDVPQTHSSQIPASYGQQNYIQGSQTYESQTHGSQAQNGYGQKNSGYVSQTYSPQTPTGYEQTSVHGSQSYHGSQPKGNYGQQNSVYGSHASGSQIDESQNCGPQGCSPQGAVTHVSHGSVTHSSMTHNYGVGFGSNDGSLTHGFVDLGSASDCNDESRPQSYSQIRRHKRYSIKPPPIHKQGVFDPPQQSSQTVEDFGEAARIQKVSQQEIEALGQQVEDIRHGKLQTQDIHQQSQDFTQQTQDFTQQSEQLGNDYYQQGRRFDDFSQQTGKLEFGQNQNHDHSQHFGKTEFGQQHQHLSQIPNLSQQTQDFSQLPDYGFDHQQHMSQIEPLSQQTQGFGDFPKPEKFKDLTQQTQKVIDFSQQPRGFDQQTVGNLKLHQPARDSLDFNQFPTPVLAPDSNHSRNQRFEGVNQPFNLPAKPAPKPTSRPRNPKSTQFSLDENAKAETIFNTNQEIQSPFENLRHTGRGDISAEKEDVPTDQALTPPEVLDTQVGYQQSSEDRFHNKDFSQQVQKPGEDFSEQKSDQELFQEVQKPFEDFSQQVQTSFKDFSQQVQKPREGFSQQVQSQSNDFSQEIQRPFEDFSQQLQRQNNEFSLGIQKHFQDFSQQVQSQNNELSQGIQKHFKDFSQQVQKPFEDFSQQIQSQNKEFSLGIQKPFEDFSQQVQNQNKEFSQEILKPFEDFSQHVQKLRDDSSQKVQKPREGFSQQVQKPFEDFSQQVQSQNKEFSQEIQKPFEDFSEHVQKLRDDSSQKVQKPFEDFTQQVQSQNKDFALVIQKPYKDFSQEVQKPFEDFSQQVQSQNKEFSQEILKPVDGFSQQVQKPRDDSSQKVQKPFEDFTQQVQSQNKEFSQEIREPFEDFSEQVQKPREGYSQQVQEPFKDFSQQVQKPHQDFSQISDLNRNKDITQLPQEPRGGSTQSHQAQNKLTDHISSDMSQQSKEISLGALWHRSHHPGDLTNENYNEKIEQIPQREETPEKKHFIRFGQQSSKKVEKRREFEVEQNTDGKLEFGQSVTNHGSDSQLRNERTTDVKLQPRILEAYGGRGPYDPMHGEDLFSGAKLNPSATLPPYIQGDPWDIREKPVTPRVVYDDEVVPLDYDSSWVFPDAYPNIPAPQTPRPGFWSRVGTRFSGAVDKAKEKARDIFG